MKGLEHMNDRNEGPTIWLATMKPELVELREMLEEATSEAAECAHTAAGRKKTMAFLATVYRHSLENLTLADRASERADREAAIVLSGMHGIIDDVIIRLEEIIATPPASARTHRHGVHQLRGH